MFQPTCFTPTTGPTIRKLAEMQPTTLAIMHGSSYNGDCTKELLDLADDCERRMTTAMPEKPLEPVNESTL